MLDILPTRQVAKGPVVPPHHVGRETVFVLDTRAQNGAEAWAGAREKDI